MGILDWFRNRPPILEKETAPSDETTRRAIDKAVTLVNPRLRLLPDYQERLSPAINTTIDYLRASLTDLPPTLRLSPAEWASEPLWRAFFASTDDISRTLAYSKGLKTLFDKYPEINEACFILGMNIRDQRIDGMTLHGDMVQRNVPQRVLGFSRHVARICGQNEAEVRRLLGIQSFEYLVSQAIARLGDERSGRQGWFALLAPKGTPAAILDQLNTVVNEILSDPEVKKKLADMGSAPLGGTRQALADHLAAETTKWRQIVRAAKIQVQ